MHRAGDRRRARAYKISLYSFLLGVVVLLLTPASCVVVVGDGGMDRLDDLLGALVVHVVASGVLALISVVSGVYVRSERRNVMLWVLPSFIWLLTIGFYALLMFAK